MIGMKCETVKHTMQAKVLGICPAKVEGLSGL